MVTSQPAMIGLARNSHNRIKSGDGVYIVEHLQKSEGRLYYGGVLLIGTIRYSTPQKLFNFPAI